MPDPYSTVMSTIGRIGRYLRMEPIGRGAMGVVYRAEDPLIHRTVAVKVLHAPTGMEPEQMMIARERFRREAQAAGSLDHPHIVRIFDVGEDETTGELFIVMEHLPGPSLEAMIAGAALEVDASVEIIGQVASGLDAAHERRMVHRDVKPSNVLFSERGTAKLVDFGITQVAASSLTQDVTRLGTPAYMSPEQLGGKMVDARADLFSLGVLGYEVLTGSKPFAGVDLISLAYAISQTEPGPISKANPRLPSSLDRVFALMLAKNPADRFASGKAFHEAIVRCLKEDGIKRHLLERPRRRMAPLAWLGAGAVLAAASLALLTGREPAAAPVPVPVAEAPRPVAPPAPARKPAAAKPALATTQATISLTHRVRRGTLVVSMDGVPIFNEEFTKARMAISQTTTWDPVRVAAGRHALKARVTGDDGATYVSEVYTIELSRAKDATFRIRQKGDKLLIQTI